jgi:hypothetical protein
MNSTFAVALSHQGPEAWPRPRPKTVVDTATVISPGQGQARVMVKIINCGYRGLPVPYEIKQPENK